jgi:hypothetical protein
MNDSDWLQLPDRVVNLSTTTRLDRRTTLSQATEHVQSPATDRVVQLLIIQLLLTSYNESRRIVWKGLYCSIRQIYCFTKDGGMSVI